MTESSEHLISLRPGGASGINPFAAFSQGAGGKVAVQKVVVPQSGTPHSEVVEERKKELGVDVLKYSAAYLLQFSERNTRAPAGLQAIKGLILDEVAKTSAVMERAAAETPGGAGAEGSAANWRSKGPSGAAAAASAASGMTATAAAAAAMPDVKIQTAQDIGRTKWEPVKDLSSTDQGRQKLRGILNKLTPDNFDKLVAQVLGIMSVSAAMLRVCIPLIFEKAVAEPTFCALYAELCAVLSRELDSRAAFGSDAGKPVTFKRELLNTCQDQFEAMETQRAELLAGGEVDERARRALRMRELGTVRLLAELYNKELVTAAIMKIVVGGLMARGCPDGHFDGDLIECIVQAISIAGAKMSVAEKLSKQLKGWLGTLGAWSKDSALEARVRFKIQDLLDQVKMSWQARREQNTVKKTEEIRKAAHAELGMIQTAVPDFLPGLNIAAAVAAPAKEDDSVLFPGMEDVGLRPDDPAAATDTATPAPPKGELSDEEVTKKAGGTVSEFMSIRDFQEAEACVRELGCTEGQEALVVSAALQACYDSQKEDERAAVYKMLVHLADRELLSAEGVRQGFYAHTEGLEDLSMDVPMSPQILGRALAALLIGGAVQFACLEGLLDKVESCEPKRRLVAKLMPPLEEGLGREGAVAMVKESGVPMGVLLDADAAFEPSAASVFDWVKMEGLEWVPL